MKDVNTNERPEVAIDDAGGLNKRQLCEECSEVHEL